MSPSSISASVIRSGTNRPTSLSRMKVPIAREDDHPERGQRLPPEQVQAAAGDHAGEDRFGHRVVGEDPDQEAAGEPGEAVRVDHAERVVHVAERRARLR